VDQPVAPRRKPEHLICGSGWALLAAVACTYFGYRAYIAIAQNNEAWGHGWWEVITWAVWMVLAAVLISETRCWRERILFTLLLLIFALGLVLSLWISAPFAAVGDARIATTALWALATVAALIATFAPLSRTPTNHV
jgi:hypothetical protein